MVPSGATLPNTNFAALNKVSDTNKVYYTLDYDATTDETADWTFPAGDTAPTTVNIDLYWIATGGTTTQSVAWDVTQDGVGNDEVWDAAGTTVNLTGSLVATGDINRITLAGTSAEFGADELVHIRVTRDANGTNNVDSLASDAKLLGVIIRLE